MVRLIFKKCYATTKLWIFMYLRPNFASDHRYLNSSEFFVSKRWVNAMSLKVQSLQASFCLSFSFSLFLIKIGGIYIRGYLYSLAVTI